MRLEGTRFLSFLEVLVESPDRFRFACDLAVQLAGHDMLKREGIALVPGFTRLFTPPRADAREARTAESGPDCELICRRISIQDEII